ncbi:MAG: hypothetical protein IKP66_07575, partial [Lachnospiraceae bacterium]|nr:hypothetical protein [Lachnospiraceae bacterium]
VDTLREWYTVAKEKYKRERGNKGNNLIGSNLDTIIESDYSISEQIEAVDYYLKNVVEISKYKETMARNELMAKYMMENSRINDIIKDYSVGINFITENLQRGTSRSKNTKSIVLSDFQVLEFDHTLNEKNKHSDDDGITDLEELTGKANGDIEIDRVKWVEITSPLKKAYISKKGSEVGYAEELKRLFTNNGGKFDKNGNKILIGHFDYDENNRAYYRTTNYVSNPMLNDTDFDGIQDNEDSNKTRGEFKGSAGDIGKIEYTNDFRNFFVDNYKYNDELSVMSLMIANGKYVDTNQVNVNSIKQYIERLGFKNVLLKENFRISNEETIKGKLYIGKKTIQYRTYESKSDNKGKNSYKDIYGVFLMDFDNEINMKQLVVNFDIDMIETHYDYIARDVERYVDEYMTMYQSNDDYCFWVTGYSIAGGVASHVSPYLIGKGETYTYTFGAPNTTKGGSTANVNVKNIINEDDVIPKILNIKDGYSRVGETYNDSIFDNLQKEYRKLVGSFKNYEAYTKKANTVKRAITNIKSKEATKTLKDKVCKLLSKFLSNFEYIHDGVTMAEYPEIGVYLNPNVKKVKDGHSKKAYYALAKTLNGFDLDNYDVNWTTYEEEISSEEERNNEQRYTEDLLSAIEIVGNWYIQNVPTYETSEEANRTTQTQRDNAEKLRETSWGGIYIYKYDDLGTQTNEYIDERVE